MAELDLRTPRRVHFVGVGGAGLSAMAGILHAMGHTVTGSDLRVSAGTERVGALGVDVTIGHAPRNVRGADVVVVSTAIPGTNPEVVAATEQGIPVLRRAEMLAAICATRRTLAVAGTHGKTTTSSMLALVLVEAGLRPSFIVGGEVNEIGSGAAWDDGEWLVVEADESDGTFLELGAEAAVVTSLEPDHLGHYGGWPQLQDAFKRFVTAATGPRVLCRDDEHAASLAATVDDAITYGTSPEAEYRMVDVELGRSQSRFSVQRAGLHLGVVDVAIPGLHNARNACAALVAGLAVGAGFDEAARALGRFAGVARRFQFRGEAGGVTLVDDYAHLPTEVAAALAAARAGGWRRVVCVFQPHRFSRTADLWRDFAGAFADADLLVVTDVYPADEQPRPGVTGHLIVQAVLDSDPRRQVAYLPDRRDWAPYLRRVLRPGDVCITLGAGDLTLLADDVLEAMR